MSFTEYCQTWQFLGGYAAGVSDGKFKIIGQSWILKHILASINMKGDFFFNQRHDICRST